MNNDSQRLGRVAPVSRTSASIGRRLGLPVAAVLAILCLLVSFHQAVRGAVRRGELWRSATALNAQAAMRCNALSGRPVRESCLVQLNASLRDDAALQSLSAATAAQFGHTSSRPRTEGRGS